MEKTSERKLHAKPKYGTHPDDFICLNPGVLATIDGKEYVCLDRVDFASILAHCERLLTEARRLADWTENENLYKAGLPMISRLADKWLILDYALAANGIGHGDPVFYGRDNQYLAAARCMHELANTIRQKANMFKHMSYRFKICIVRCLSDSHVGMPYSIFARKVAVVVDLLREIVAAKKSQRAPMTVKEANRKGMELTNTLAKRKKFFAKSETQQAKKIGCSWGTWSKTDCFKEAVNLGWLPKRKNGDMTTQNRQPSVVSLSPALEAKAGHGERDEVLRQLAAAETTKIKRPHWDDLPSEERHAILAEHQADVASDPSPLECRPWKVLNRKQL
jgi:hypothetical protein